MRKENGVTADAKEVHEVLFDVAAAFPSLSHAYLHRLLKRLKLPEGARWLVEAFYHDNKCRLKLHGQVFDGFPLSAGIRQGCPLSPLLFAVVADVFLRRLDRFFPGDMTRAYADDTAMVLQDINSLKDVAKEFDKYAEVSGLKLNIAKTVVIPLFFRNTSLDDISKKLASEINGWEKAKVQYSGTYLGFEIGPERGEAAWEKPIKKLIERTTSWCKKGLGLTWAAFSYQIYLLPVLSFVAQLERPPTGWDSIEK